MQYQRVSVYPNDELLLPYDGESFYCPMCGESCGSYPPFDEDGRPVFDWICTCSFFPDKDDGPSEHCGLTQEQYVAAYRKQWLSENDWAPELVERLRAVFQLTDNDGEMIRQAAELK